MTKLLQVQTANRPVQVEFHLKKDVSHKDVPAMLGLVENNVCVPTEKKLELLKTSLVRKAIGTPTVSMSMEVFEELQRGSNLQDCVAKEISVALNGGQ